MMKKLRLACCLILALAMCGKASAVYNANMSGQVEGYYIYADGDYIYFRLKNRSASHPACNSTYFIIPETVSSERRKMMFARLLLAYATQENVNLGSMQKLKDGKHTAHV